MKRATDNKKENRNIIDVAIDKALEKTLNTRKEIENFIDNFLAEEVVPWMVVSSVHLKVYEKPQADGTLLEVYQQSESAVLTCEKFSDEIKSDPRWFDYFMGAVYTLERRTDRISIMDVQTDGDEPYYEYLLSLKMI